MKDEELKKALETMNPTRAQEKEMLQKLIEAHGVRGKEGEEIMKRTSSKNIFYGLLTTAAALVLIFTLRSPMKEQGTYLYKEGGVLVKEVVAIEKPRGNPSAITMFLNEEEIFGFFQTEAFLGTVTVVKNLAFDFQGDIYHRGLVEITVAEVLEGNTSVGQKVSMLLPGPVAEGKIWGADFHVTRAMKEGEQGLFMPMFFGEDEVWEENGEALPMKAIADGQLLDTERFAFMDTKEGILFARDTFQGLKEAKTLEEIKAYVLQKRK